MMQGRADRQVRDDDATPVRYNQLDTVISKLPSLLLQTGRFAAFLLFSDVLSALPPSTASYTLDPLPRNRRVSQLVPMSCIYTTNRMDRRGPASP